jgi:hypothetical protein
MTLRRQIIYCHCGKHNLIAGRGILTWMIHSSFIANTIKWLLVVTTMVRLKVIQRGHTLNSLIIHCKIPEHINRIRSWITFFEFGIYFQFPFHTVRRIPAIRCLEYSVFLKFIQLCLASCFDNQLATFRFSSKLGFPSWSKLQNKSNRTFLLWKHSTKLGTCSCSVVTSHT